MNRILRLACSAALALAAVGARAAEEQGGAGTVYPKAHYPYGELVKQPLTLAQGLIEVNVPVEVNLSKDLVGKPWNIPAAIDYGFTDGLQLGIFHETGFCLAGTSNGCEKVYDDLGARVRLGVHRDPDGQLALQVALLAASFDHGWLDGAIGAAYKRTLGRLAFVLEANLAAALNEREDDVSKSEDARRLAKEVFEGAGELQLQLLPGFAAFGRIAYQKLFEERAGSNVDHVVPVGFGVEYEIYPRIGLGAELTFDNLLGKDATADERTGVVFARLFL